MLQLFGMLLSGADADAGGAFNDREAARVRGALEGDERMECYVRGRVVGTRSRATPALWVLTDQRLLTFEMATFKRSSVTLDNALHVEVKTGKYGVSLILRQSAQRLGLYAVDAGLAFVFSAALAHRLPALPWSIDLKPALPETLAAAAEASTESRSRVNRPLRHDAPQAVALLRDLDALQQRGVLNAAQFSDLRTRLFAVA